MLMFLTKLLPEDYFSNLAEYQEKITIISNSVSKWNKERLTEQAKMSNLCKYL